MRPMENPNQSQMPASRLRWMSIGMAVFGLTTILFALWTLRLWLKMRIEHPESRCISVSVGGDQAPKEDERKIQVHAAPTRIDALPPREGSRQSPEPSTDPTALDGNCALNERCLLGAQQRLLRKTISRDIAQWVNASPDLIEQLVEMLARHPDELFRELQGIPLDREGFSAVREKRQAVSTRQDAEIAALLGPELKGQFDVYRDSSHERAIVRELRGSLGSADALGDEQVKPLVAALSAGVSERAQTNGLNLIQAKRAEVLERATAVLSKPQLEVLEEILEAQMLSNFYSQSLERSKDTGPVPDPSRFDAY